MTGPTAITETCERLEALLAKATYQPGSCPIIAAWADDALREYRDFTPSLIATIRHLSERVEAAEGEREALWQAALVSIRLVEPLIKQGEDRVWRPAKTIYETLTAALPRAALNSGEG